MTAESGESRHPSDEIEAALEIKKRLVAALSRMTGLSVAQVDMSFPRKTDPFAPERWRVAVVFEGEMRQWRGCPEPPIGRSRCEGESAHG